MKLEVPRKLEVQLTGATKNELRVDGKAIDLNVNTSTDWPAVAATSLVGIGSIITAIIVANISRRNQQSQSRTTLAGFRKEWQAELRSACSRLVALAKASQMELLTDEGSAVNLKSHITELMEIKALIDLLLDPDIKQNIDEEKRTRRTALRSAMDSVTDALQKSKVQNHDELNAALKNFRDSAKLVLEDAWLDVKRDVDGL